MIDSRTAEATGTLPDDEVEEDTGLQVEKDDPREEITEPFDPEQIKINTRSLVVDQIMTRIEDGVLDLAPDFQRLRGIWDSERKSRLIESLLLRIPIPVFYMAADDDDRWSVVDGVQRISTIHEYVTDEFPLSRLQYLTSLEKCKHASLPRRLQRRINETELSVNVIDPGTPPEVMYNVFLRINTGGMTLNGQEIRHALNPGPVRDYLKELAQSEEFVRATDNSVKETRMADRECVLRFLSFRINPWEDYSANDLDGYLGRVMKALNGMEMGERKALTRDFKKAMSAAYDLFGENAFRKPTSDSGRRRPINRALLEAWSVQLARCSVKQISALVEQRIHIQRRFKQLVEEDDEFERAISYSTGSRRRVHKRFQAIEQLVKDFL